MDELFTTTLVDLVRKGRVDKLPSAVRVDPPTWVNLSWLISAKKMVLDDDAMIYLGDLATNNKRLLDDLIEFAIPPFDNMVFELHFEAEAPSPVVLMCWSEPQDNVWSYMFRPDRSRAIGAMVPRQDKHTTKAQMLGYEIVALCLLLQAKKAVISDHPARRSLSHGRQVTYFAHSKIKIDLTTPKQLRRCFSTGTHATPRRHEVMGHFVHRGGDRGCTHQWQVIVRDPDDNIKRWECTDCERKRTWRKAFARGDAGKGFVRQQYEVTAS